MPRSLVLEYYRDADRQWRWTLYSSNRRKIACSGEGYKQFRSCQRGAKLTTSAVANPNGLKIITKTR